MNLGQAVKEIKRLGGTVEMNLREGDLRTTGLNLPGTQVKDADLVLLQALPTLETLRLKDTAVTDAGLEHCKALPRLRYLDLRGTQVTDRGIESLRRDLPGVKIDR
jgi:hypothetical protein